MITELLPGVEAKIQKPLDSSKLIWLLICLILAGCGMNVVDLPGESRSAAPSLTPFQPLPDTTGPTSATQSPSPTNPPALAPTLLPTALPESGNMIWIPNYLPQFLLDHLALPGDYQLSADPGSASISLDVGDEHPLSRWVYALVAPYPTLVDGVSAEAVRSSWGGEPRGPFASIPLLVDESTKGVFSVLWGEPAPGAVKILSSGELLDYAWANRPAWALVPFEAIGPRWKVLEVGGQSPLRVEFVAEDYPLSMTFSLQGDTGGADALLTATGEQSLLPATNRDPARLTTVAMTGVTALVRATAFTMRRNGVTYPAQDVGPLLRRADVTHMSNEIPFTPECPPPDPTQPDLRFCSDPGYIALLEEVGADVIELTGDHFGDWGPEAMRYTLDLYIERDWTYYGGGYDRQDARQARLIEHNGNRLAFIGCNAKGGGYATAGDTQPGAVACDFDWMESQIRQLRSDGYQVIATFQHFEYYTYAPQPGQLRDFRRLAEAGAAIVSGSQAHQPQGIEFAGDAFLHYGLGNLFFDQYHFCTDNACDDGFIDRHVFYDGRYIGNDLLTIVFVDYARPRLMTAEEREVLLAKVFAASGW